MALRIRGRSNKPNNLSTQPRKTDVVRSSGVTISTAPPPNLKAPARASSTVAVFPVRVGKPKPGNEQIDLSDLDLQNQQYKPTERHGISAYRSEIVAVTGFKPIYDGWSSTSTGQMLDNQEQLLAVRIETFVEFMLAVKKWNQDAYNKATESVRNGVDQNNEQVGRIIEAYRRFSASTTQAKSKFDIRNIPTSAYTTPQRMTMRDLFEASMQYDKSEFDSFSNTKLWLQMCQDLKSILENYSYGLMGSIDRNRISDKNPTVIDTSYDPFRFRVESLKSVSNASVPATFTSVLNGLPYLGTDRIKVLLHTLSKELRASKALGTDDALATSFRQRYAATVTPSLSPWQVMIGSSGPDIYTKSNAPAELSLVSFAQVPTGGESSTSIVLPFESKFVDSKLTQGNPSYAPGTSYYVDSVLDITKTSTPSFNTDPLVRFASGLSDSVAELTKNTSSLLQLADTKSVISPNGIVCRLNVALKNSTSGLLDVQNIDTSQGSILAVFKLANKDTQLKNRLFQWYLFAGVVSQSNQNSKTAFKILGNELGNTQSLSYVKKIAGIQVDLTSIESSLNRYHMYLEALAQDIEDRVFYLASGRPIPEFRSLIPDGTTTQTSYSPVSVLNLEALNADGRPVFLSEGYIKTTLMNCVKPSGSTNNLMKECMAMFGQIIDASCEDAKTVYLTENTTLTKLNGLSTSTLSLLLFEAFVCFADLYTPAQFGNSRYKTRLNLLVDIKKNKMTRAAIDSVIGVKAPPPNGTSVQIYQYIENLRLEQFLWGPEFPKIMTSLSDILDKVNNEQKTVQNFLHVFQVINRSITEAKQGMVNAFNNTTLQSFLEYVGGDTNILETIKNPSQTRGSVFLYEEMREHLANGQLINGFTPQLGVRSFVTPQEKTLMTVALSQPKYRIKADERLRVLTVGVPVGMSQTALSDRTTTNRSNLLLRNKQSDVVRIKVYKRDARYDDIVFYPQEWLVDLSLFFPQQSIVDSNPVFTETYEQLLSRISLVDYALPESTKAVTLSSMVTNEEYDFLTEQDKRRLFSTHVESKVLEDYLQLMTGMDISEPRFTVASTSTSVFNKELSTLVRSYMLSQRGVSLPQNLTFEEMLSPSNTSIPGDIKSVLRCLVYGTIDTDPKKSIYNHCVSSRLFERVYHLPVNTDVGWYVDLDMTTSTESGKRAIRQSFVQDMLIETPDTGSPTGVKVEFKPTDPQSDILFADFFVTMEPANLL